MTSFLASLALLCAQFLQLPSLAGGGGNAAVTSAPFAATAVARSSGFAGVATAERATTPHAKSASPLDVVLANGLAVYPPAPATIVPFARSGGSIVTATQTAYRARAPPNAGPATNHIQLN